MSLPLLGAGCSAPSSPSSLLTNLVAYYKFADANDSHTGGLNLTEVNSPTYVAGQVGNCVNLVAASSQTLTRASETLLQLGGGSFAISCWVYQASANNANGIVAKCTNNSFVGSEYCLDQNFASNRYRFTVVDSSDSTTQVLWGSNYTTGVWTHLFAYYDHVAQQIGLSVNNAAAVTASHTTGVRTGSQTFSIGSAFAPPRYFDGRIDEVAIWKGSVLTTTQRTNLYTAQLAGSGSYPFAGIP